MSTRFKTIRILLIEDNPGDARLLEELLSELPGYSFEITCAETLADGCKRLAKDSFDIVLLDLSLPDSHGLDTFSKASSHTPETPIIIMTGLDDEELGTKAVQEGAQDYLVKGQVDANSLIRSIRYSIERKRVERELEETRQEQLKMKDQFLSHISHELRSPLTAIHQFSTIILDGLAGEINDEQREYMDIILKNATQLRSMIGDLLEITRADAGTLLIEAKQISITELITEVINTHRLAAKEKQISLSAKILENLPPIHADPARAQEILSNLVGNALKFTPDKGTITISAEVYKQDPKLICVAVTDNGCGISPDGVKMIFERMFQEKISPEANQASRKGLGLGLYICKELVTRQGGGIWVKSKLGEGSTFCFTLPISE